MRSRSSFILGSSLASGILGACCSTLLAGSVSFTWNASPSPSAVGYNIYYGGASGQYTNHLTVAGSSTTNAVVCGLPAGVTYYFAANAYDASNNVSVFSDEVSTVALSPEAPMVMGVAPSATNSCNICASYNLPPCATNIQPATADLYRATSLSPQLGLSPWVKIATLPYPTNFDCNGNASIPFVDTSPPQDQAFYRVGYSY